MAGWTGMVSMNFDSMPSFNPVSAVVRLALHEKNDEILFGPIVYLQSIAVSYCVVRLYID